MSRDHRSSAHAGRPDEDSDRRRPAAPKFEGRRAADDAGDDLGGELGGNLRPARAPKKRALKHDRRVEFEDWPDNQRP